jgi:PTH1 family peptidyl-tRNA hydrolase
VVGLGNPGRRYRSTRHNAGLTAADVLIGQGSVRARGKWADGELALMETSYGRFLVLKPSTYMNSSGRAVAPVLKCYGIAPDQMIVIHDDIDIPLGEARVKKGGGTGGHRGLASLVEDIGSGDFTRVRIGVGRPPEGVDPADYVLMGFEEGEREPAAASTEQAALAVIDLLRGAESGNA